MSRRNVHLETVEVKQLDGSLLTVSHCLVSSVDQRTGDYRCSAIVQTTSLHIESHNCYIMSKSKVFYIIKCTVIQINSGR